MSYQEFPKVMNHPNYRPATHVMEQPGQGPLGKPGAQGSPAVLPPVTVHNAEQEAEYAAKGYVPAGVSDPDAYFEAMNGTPVAHKHQEYPKWKYHAEGSRIVHTAAEERDLGEGWFDTPDLTAPEAPKPMRARRQSLPYDQRTRAH